MGNPDHRFAGSRHRADWGSPDETRLALDDDVSKCAYVLDEVHVDKAIRRVLRIEREREAGLPSPCVYRRVEISREGGRLQARPPCTTANPPRARSAMNSRESPGGACKSIGAAKAAAENHLQAASRRARCCRCYCTRQAGAARERDGQGIPHSHGETPMKRPSTFRCVTTLRPSAEERVASLENRYDLSSGIFVRDLFDPLRDPGVVGFGEGAASPMSSSTWASNPAEMERSICGREGLVERRHPDFLHRRGARPCRPNPRAAVRWPCSAPTFFGAAVRVINKRMLEDARHQRTRSSSLKNVLGCRCRGGTSEGR